MTPSSDDSIDFKPFFDMVVGVLFILLILISAQMFFSQWPTAPTPAEVAAREAEARRVRAEQDAGVFLNDLAERLRRAGFSPSVDRLSRSISVPTDELVRAGAPAQPRPDPAALARFAPAVLAALRCIAAADPAEGCPGDTSVRLSRMDAHAQLAAPTPGATPPAALRLAGLELAAGLFAAAPDLLALGSPQGMPAVGGTIAIETVATGPRFRLDFALTGPDMRSSP